VTACTWYWVIEIREVWMPPLDWMYLQSDLFDSSNQKMYWSSFYHSVLMLNGNELGPRTEAELIFVGCILILGAIINANIFGNMAVIIQELSIQQMRFQSKIDTANTAMKNMRMPKKIIKEVVNFIKYT
jgi:hypothetical protein